MSIRTYLTLSYAGMILLLILGMWVMSDHLAAQLAANNLATAQKGSQRTIAATYKIAEDVLTVYGEKMVQMKVEGVAKGLGLLMKGKDLHNYAQLRADEVIRKSATQGIQTPEGLVGYLLVSDRQGEIIFHPNREVEGKNSANWQEQYPETQALLKRSLSEDRVFGYYTFKDRNGQERKRYSARVHVSGTPFIVAANVNIDEFFLPAQARIREASQKIMLESQGRIKANSQNIGRQIKGAALVGGLLLALVGGFSGLLFASLISRPILHLRDAVGKVGEGDFSASVTEKGLKEVSQLARSFNQLGRQLTEYIEKRDFIRDTFGRYVTQEVVKKLLEDKGALELGGETREVSIVMCDLRGFTALTAEMDPEKVIVFLNRYLGKMIAILLDHRAIIDEIVGDGILAFFGAPEPMADHAFQAVACALKMQEAMEEINSLNEADGLPHLEMGIAVNTGAVVVGNIGSERRTKYSVVGAHVNVTSRIESYALGGQVLISPSTYSQVQDMAIVGKAIQAEMKGVSAPMTIHEVSGLRGPNPIHLKTRCETLIPLPEQLSIHLYHLKDKIVTGSMGPASITHLCETAGTVIYAGELEEWEDVRLHLLDEHQAELPGKLYGKVVAVKEVAGGLHEAAIRFTSVSPETYQAIRRAVQGA